MTDGTTAADERSFPDVRHLYGSYKRSKYVAEHEVLRAIAEGLPASIVLPTFPLGPGDRAPTPTGQLVLDFLNGRVPGFVDTILNVAHVDDVAAGQLLALERGRNGRSYILGGENLTLEQLLGELAAITGLPRARIKVPRALSLAVAAVSETVEGRILHRHPSVPLEAARMSTSQMAFDTSRARDELGYAPRPATEALEASARWFVDSGMVAERRSRRITWAQPGRWSRHHPSGGTRQIRADRVGDGRIATSRCTARVVAGGGDGRDHERDDGIDQSDPGRRDGHLPQRGGCSPAPAFPRTTPGTGPSGWAACSS